MYKYKYVKGVPPISLTPYTQVAGSPLATPLGGDTTFVSVQQLEETPMLRACSHNPTPNVAFSKGAPPAPTVASHIPLPLAALSTAALLCSCNDPQTGQHVCQV